MLLNLHRSSDGVWTTRSDDLLHGPCRVVGNPNVNRFVGDRALLLCGERGPIKPSLSRSA